MINEGRQKLVDRKELEASKKNREEEKVDASAGWGLGTKLGQPAEDPSSSMPSSASAKGPQKGGNLNFGKPMFTRK